MRTKTERRKTKRSDRQNSHSPAILHTVISGVTRYGKTELSKAINIPRMRKPNRPAFFWFDPPGPLAEDVAEHAVFLGMHLTEPTNLILDNMAETANVPGYPYLIASTHCDPDQREAENRETVSEQKGVLLHSEGKLDSAPNPIIDRGLDDSLNLFIHQRIPVPPFFLEKCFNPFYDEHHFMKGNCTHRDTFLRFQWYGRLSDKEREFHCGPAERRLRKICSCPQFRKRCLPTFDLADFINRGGCWIGNGRSTGNLSRQDVALLMGSLILQIIKLARTGKLTRRVVMIIDEGMATGLLDANVTRAMMEAAKWGLEIQVIIQNPITLAPEVRENIFQLCGRQFFFRHASPQACRFVAEMIATPNLDPMKVKFTEYFTRMVDDGYEFIETKGETRGLHDSLHFGSTIRNLRREEKEGHDRHFALEDLIKLMQRNVRRLQVGEFFMADSEVFTESPQYMPMEKRPWTGKTGKPLILDWVTKETLVSRKMKEAWEILKARPEYQTPTIAIPTIPKKKKKGME